jgi:hypothetical protein
VDDAAEAVAPGAVLVVLLGGAQGSSTRKRAPLSRSCSAAALTRGHAASISRRL